MNETLMMSKKETLKCLVQQSTSSNIYKSGISTFKTEMAAEEQALIEKGQFIPHPKHTQYGAEEQVKAFSM